MSNAIDKNGGCYICGEGRHEVLTSKTVAGQSVALCPKHLEVTTLKKEN